MLEDQRDQRLGYLIVVEFGPITDSRSTEDSESIVVNLSDHVYKSDLILIIGVCSSQTHHGNKPYLLCMVSSVVSEVARPGKVQD